MELSEAADEARRLLRGFKAFDQVAAALDRAASIEQSMAEHQAAIAKARVELDNVRADVVHAKELGDKEREAALADVHNAIEGAKVKAAAIVAEADALATRMGTELGEDVHDAEQARDAALAERDAAEKRRDELKVEVEALEARLAAAEAAKVAALKGA